MDDDAAAHDFRFYLDERQSMLFSGYGLDCDTKLFSNEFGSSTIPSACDESIG
jgi:hypothetical protein